MPSSSGRAVIDRSLRPERIPNAAQASSAKRQIEPWRLRDTEVNSNTTYSIEPLLASYHRRQLRLAARESHSCSNCAFTPCLGASVREFEISHEGTEVLTVGTSALTGPPPIKIDFTNDAIARARARARLPLGCENARMREGCERWLVGSECDRWARRLRARAPLALSTSTSSMKSKYLVDM